MSRIRKRQTPVAIPPEKRTYGKLRPAAATAARFSSDNYGRGPLTPSQDVAAIRRAEYSRDMLLGADPEWWAGE